MRDFVLIGFTPRHRPPALPAERLHEVQGLGHVDGVHALGEGHRPVQERAVRVAVLAAERGVHEHGVRTLRHIPDVRSAERDVRPEGVGVVLGHPQGPLGHVVADDHLRPQHPGADGEHPCPAPQVQDLHARYVAVGVSGVEDVRCDDRRRHVLLQGRIGVLEPADRLEPHLEVPLLHRPGG